MGALRRTAPGDTGLVHPAAALPLAAMEAGIPVLEINPQPTALSGQVDASWRLPASTGVARVLDRLEESNDPRELIHGTDPRD